jgi:HD-GYP domain-containing protein (c-di-GMP phosphodiesterase class II)
MSGSIFLLTNNELLDSKIRNTVAGNYNIINVNKSNLMVELYKLNPTMIIVDFDSYGDQIIDVIQTILSIDYIPILYIHKERDNAISIIKDEMLLPVDLIGESLLWVIKQSLIFKNRYDMVMESYGAIDLLNSVVNNLLKEHNGTKGASCNQIVNELINVIYAQNNFMNNKPETFFVFELENSSKSYKTLYYKLDKNKYDEKAELKFDMNDTFKFDLYAPNGFSKNFNVNELSDISFSEKIFPKAIKPYLTDLNNFAGYAIGDIIFIGMNYENKVTNYDIDIMKALTINFDLIDTIRHQVSELEESFDYTIDALARAAEANDDITGHHIKRVNYFAKRLAEELEMDSEFIMKIENAAQMHDVGKIYVDKTILSKPGKLTAEEFEHIKMHTVYGEKIIGNSDRLKMAVEVSRSHHEKYDGTGYPDGKIGEEIPIAARIVFLADIYDALRSDRPYKKGFTHEKAYEIITVGDGRVMPENFDPVVLNAFKKIHKDFNKIYEELSD